MPTIPLNQTITTDFLNPLTLGLMITDLLHLNRPTGSGDEPVGDYRVSLNQIRTFVQQGVIATSQVVDSVTSTSATDVLAARQGKLLRDAIDALILVVNNKLDASAYNQHYRGTYTTVLGLNTAVPTANTGDYALIDPGPGQQAVAYYWDSQDGWGSGGGAFTGTSDNVLEGTINQYFTAAKAIAAAATAFIRFDEVQSLSSTQINNVLTTLGLTNISAPPARNTLTLTTGSLDPNTVESGTVTIAKSYRLLEVSFNHPARLRLYATTAQRDADLARPIGIDPIANHGLMLEFVATNDLLAATLTPLVDGYDGKSVPDGHIAYAVTSLHTTPAPIAIDLKYIPTE